MDTLRKFALALLVGLLGLGIITGISAYSFHQTVGSAAYLKQTLAEANIYDMVGKQITSEVKQGGQDSNPTLNKALKKAAKSDTTKVVVEKGIDSVFSFLNGEITVEQISIDITPITEKLNKQLAKSFKADLAKLPACPGTMPRSSNPLELTCRPSGVDQDKLIEHAIAEAMQDNDMLADGKLSLHDIEKATEQKGKKSKTQDTSLSDNLQRLSQAYQVSELLAPVSLGVSILSAVGIVFLSSSRLKGVRRVGWTVVGNSILLVIGAVITRVVVEDFFPKDVTADALAEASQQIVKTIVVDFAGVTLRVGLMVLAIGLVLAIGAMVLLYKRQGGIDGKSIGKPAAIDPIRNTEPTKVVTSEDKPTPKTEEKKETKQQ